MSNLIVTGYGPLSSGIMEVNLYHDLLNFCIYYIYLYHFSPFIYGICLFHIQKVEHAHPLWQSGAGPTEDE